MTLAAAQSAASTFRECLLDNGVRQVSIELQPGVAGSGWFVDTFQRGMGHHIASRPSQGLTPGLGTVKNGRKGKSPLTGPLANCYGGYDLVARIITLAWANHPGEGGPWSVPGWGTVPRNDGRPRICGWEFEGGYELYTDEMHDFMARCGAGTLDWLGWLNHREPAPLECWGEHKDPWAPGRKVDRIGYTAASGRARIAAVRGTTATPAVQEDDMPTAIVQPGENVTLPNPYGDTDLLVAADNPSAKRVDIDGESVLVEGVALRIAVQNPTAPPSWRPAGGYFPRVSEDPFLTNVPLGQTGQRIGVCYAVSVTNRGHIPVAVTVAPHRS